jgi:hypothetical protein
MGLFDNKTKYKIDLIQNGETQEISYGVFTYQGYWNLRFVFATEQEAVDFINNQLKDYPKFVEA